MTGLGGALAAPAAESPLVIAAIGLIGSLIGGGVAATVSVINAKRDRDAARTSWIRDNRQEIYNQFLNNAQELLIACTGYKKLPPKDVESAIKQADLKLFSIYAVVQTLADTRVFEAARTHAYRLGALEDLTLQALEEKTEPNDDYGQIASLSRKSRHAMLYAIREQLGLSDSISLGKGYFDPFAGTELEGRDEYLVPP
jgi:hypothetical protein